MAETTIKGIVLSSFDFEEVDKIVTIFSDKYGKMSFIAKGVNKPTSKNQYSLNTFSVSEFEIFKSRLKNSMSKLKTGVLISSNFNIAKNYDNYLFANIATSLIEQGNIFSNKNYQLFKILELALQRIDKEINPFMTMVFFMFYIMKHFGGSWVLNRCYRCNKKSKIYRCFDFDDYGLVCVNCFDQSNDKIQKQEFISFLIYLNDTSFEEVFVKRIDAAHPLVLAKILIDFYENTLGIKTIAMQKLSEKKVYNDTNFIDYFQSVVFN